MDMWLQSSDSVGWNYSSCPNFNGSAVEVWERKSNSIPHFSGCAITYPCWDYNWSMFWWGPRLSAGDTPWYHVYVGKVPRVTARFVTRFNLWLRHDLWPQNASICDPARFVTKSASICDQRYTMILESKLCRGKLVFVFTLIMNATWYNMMHIYIYELCYNTYINSGARSLMLFYTNTIWISFCHIHIISHICVSCFMRHS